MKEKEELVLEAEAALECLTDVLWCIEMCGSCVFVHVC